MATFYLSEKDFGERERVVASHGEMRAASFCYSTGARAIRVENARGYFIVLPFWGHQVWRASFDGMDLHMKTGIEEPREAAQFLESYGCFMMHSGLCGVGGPGPEDDHKVHGDLPVAPFGDPRIECGEDAGGKYMVVLGTYHHYKSFSVNYKFTSGYKLYENGTVLHLSVHVDNLRNAPMEYAYLCHINFRPMDGATLYSTAPCDEKHIRVHKNIPATMPEKEAKDLKAYMDAMQKTPEVHLTVDRERQIYDPEIVSTLFYKGDEEGYAHTMQCRPDGYACYVKHPVEPLGYSLRWISRTSDEDAMGMVLPASSEHKGYSHAKREGQIRTIAAGGTLDMDITFGLLVPVEAEEVRKKIEKVLR
ncbi:MAG: DUF4432 family protein [Clostridia bacterium]|nr:DUF4432 family protein [Oscillospiraceae bacterium]MBQ7033293.1 DUF4432 family protein [Clostridia bacterium]